MALSLMLFFCRVFTSSCIVLSSRFISPDTSSIGLFQFSVENAYSVRYLTPSSAHPSVVALTAVTPLVCPKSLFLPFDFAQRPLPSMMMAMCWGRLVRSIESFKLIVGCALNAERTKYFPSQSLKFEFNNFTKVGKYSQFGGYTKTSQVEAPHV